MSNFNVRIRGNADLTQMHSSFGRLESQVAALNAELQQTAIVANGVNPAGFERMQRLVAQNSRTFRAAAASTGMWETEQLRVNSATSEYTRLLEKQKVSFRDWRKNQSTARAAYREQLQMQQMIVRQMPGTRRGRIDLDLAVPTEVNKSWDTLGNRVGWFNEQLKSSSTQLVNWGKNTQWAGRQLMVGLTMPVAAFGAATGILAYQVDKQLTRIQKVYDTTADANNTSVEGQIALERELSAVREESLNTALLAAKEYGSSASETLDVQAELAATGQRGAELQKSTSEVMRIATLGEMEYADALNATISLQSVFRMSTEELTKSFDYMNAVENATSLQLKDFATAIPIAAAPIKQMGGDIYELGVLLTAMRERGIEATQGANAIKAAMQRLYRPSKQIKKEFAALTGQDITKIVDNAANLTEIMQGIGRSVEGLSKQDTTKVFAGLFGSYQVTRMSALVEGVGDLDKGIGQVSAAHDLASQSATDHADAAEREMARAAKSVSGQFDRALETVKIQLAEMGSPFIVVATKIIQGVSKIIEIFNGLPDFAKIGISASIAFAAIAGPIIMLVGLFANLAGNTLKVSSSMIGLLTRFELLNKESAASKVATRLAAEGFTTEASAVRQLTLELQKLHMAQATANRGTRQSALAATGAGRGSVYAAGIPWATQSSMLGKNVTAVDGTTAKTSETIAKNSETTKRNWRGVGTNVAVAAGAMALVAGQGDGIVNDLATMVLYATLLGPLLGNLPWGRMGSGIAGVAGKFKGRGGLVPAIKAGGKGVAGMIVQFGKFLGPAGLLAAAIGGMVILHSKIDDNAQALERLNDTGEKWSEIFDYSFRESGTIIDPETGEEVSSLTKRVKELNKAAPEVGNAISDAMDKAGDGMRAVEAEAEAMNIAIRQGLQVLSSGGDAKQAREAVETSLMAGIKDATRVAELMTKVDLRVDFKVNRQVLRENIEQTLQQIETAVKDEAAKTKVEMVLDWIAGTPDAQSDASKQSGIEAAEAFYDMWETASNSNKIKMIRQIQKANEDLRTEFIEGYFMNPETAKILEKHNIKTGSDFLAMAGKFSAEEYKILDKSGVDYFKTLESIQRVNETNVDFAQRLAELSGLNVDETKNLEAVLTGIVPNYKTISAATESYTNQVEAAQALMGNLSNEQKLQILNQLRLARGQKATGNLADMFGKSTKEVVKTQEKGLEVTEKQTKELNKQTRAQKIIASITKEDVASMAKEAMTSFQQGIADATMENFTSRMERALDAVERDAERRTEALRRRQETESERLDRRHERQQIAMDNRWEKRRDAIEGNYDNRIDRVDNRIERFDDRIDGINKVIEAEERAEEIRKRIFDAEMQRLDRLNESANRNIDFNVALNSGNLDEAAKIRNDMEAQASEWALADAAAAGERGHGRRLDKHSSRIDRHNQRIEGLEENKRSIEEARDARIKAIEDVEEAERRTLERRQEREDKFLDRQQNREEKALQNSLEHTKKMEQRKWETRERYIEKSLDDFTGYISTSTKDLRRHIKIWEKEHKGLSLYTQGRFNLTADNINKYIVKSVGKSRREMVNGKEWEVSGQRIAKDMIKGAFGVGVGRFKKWLVTGNPKFLEAANKKNKDPRAGWSAANLQAWNESRHEGGEIGTGGGSRKGVARNASIHPSERIVLAQKGEYMVNRAAASRNKSTLDAINSGKNMDSNPTHGTGGPGLGFAGIFGAMMYGAIRSTMGQGINNAAMFAAQQAAAGNFTAAKAGTYGDRSFTPEQLRNANTIANVGKGMGMSARDIQIGIMTAITESGLVNVRYGDRDSQGLFQQRPSQGWGTIAQVTDPEYASRKFFQTLKQQGNRADMSPWMAAQTVQRSAFADGSNYRGYWDEAQAIFDAMGTAALSQGRGGWHLPIKGRRVGNTHAPGAGSDIAVAKGTPVRAVYDGRVITSKDIYGNQSEGYASYGRYIMMQHDLANGPHYSLYAHLNSRGAQAGQRVKGGTVLGRSGNTGNSTGPHLHFEVGPGVRANSAAYPGSFLANRGLPALKDGAFTLSDGMAMLHKGETVLTADLSKQLFAGMERFANGGNATYNLMVNANNANASADDIARAAVRLIERAEKRKPRSRSGS